MPSSRGAADADTGDEDVPHWQVRPGTPIVTEDDGWAETARRLSAAERGKIIRGLTGRDRMLLELLGEHRYLTTDAISTLLFPNLRDAQSRLLRFRPPIIKRDRHGNVRKQRNVEGLGLIMRWSRAAGGPWHKLPAVYLLRQKGALVLAELRRQDADGAQRLVQSAYNAATYATHLEHDLGVVGFFAGLVRASRDLPDQGVRRWAGEAAMRRFYKQEPGAPAPDALGRYLIGDREVLFQLEWDEGTEPLTTLTAKAANYGDYWVGKPGQVVLWAVTRSQREDKLRQAIERGVAGRQEVAHWVTSAEMLEQVGHLGPVWRSLDSNTRVPLTHLRADESSEDVRACLGKPNWWEVA